MIWHSVFRGGKRNAAMDAICFHGKGRLCVKLIGQSPLDQLPFLAGALGPGTQGRYLHAAFLPIEMKLGPTTLYQSLLSPSDRKVPIRLLECDVRARGSKGMRSTKSAGLAATGRRIADIIGMPKPCANKSRRPVAMGDPAGGWASWSRSIKAGPCRRPRGLRTFFTSTARGEPIEAQDR
jgi:hypothetical protein